MIVEWSARRKFVIDVMRAKAECSQKLDGEIDAFTMPVQLPTFQKHRVPLSISLEPSRTCWILARNDSVIAPLLTAAPNEP